VRGIPPPVAFALGLLAFLSAPCAANEDWGTALQAEIVAPPLVEQGVAFEATLLVSAGHGLLPVRAGERVRIDGHDLVVDGEGRIAYPAISTAGNTFLADLGTGRHGRTELRFRPRHVEVVAVAPDLPVRVAHASRTLRPGGTATVLGQRLDRLRPTARLVGDAGRTVLLARPVFRSSLAIAWPVPQDLPQGTWRIVTMDEAGVEHPAPSAAHVPTVQVTGADVTDLRHDGVLTLSADADTVVTVSEGLPRVAVHASEVALRAGEATPVRYTPLVTGPFEVVVTPRSPLDDPPPPGAPGVHVEPSTIDARFDAATGETQVRGSVRLLHASGGRPAGDVPVYLLLSHPGGLEYGRAVTGPDGVATLTARVRGSVPASAIRAHLWGVPESRWSKPRPSRTCVLGEARVMHGPQDATKHVPFVAPSLALTARDDEDFLEYALPAFLASVTPKGRGQEWLFVEASARLYLRDGSSRSWRTPDEGRAGGGPVPPSDEAIAMSRPQELTCSEVADPPTIDVSYPPAGTIAWKAPSVRLGSKAPARPRALLLEVDVMVSCGASERLVRYAIVGDVAVVDGEWKVVEPRLWVDGVPWT
jgi:hypothetical protein